jgi:hypothetical protein
MTVANDVKHSDADSSPPAEETPQEAAPAPVPAAPSQENSIAVVAANFSRLLRGHLPKSQNVVVEAIHEVGVPQRFIAVSRQCLMERLTAPEYWEDHKRPAVRDALHCLGRVRQQDSSVKLDELMDAYQPFDPDDSMEFAEPLSWEQKAEQREVFLAGVEQLVFRSNFTLISRESLEKILSQTSPYGVEVEVDLDEFEPLIPFYRGLSYEKRTKRDWRWAYLLKTTYTMPSYQRLFLALTLKPAEKRIVEIQEKYQLTLKQAAKRFKRMRQSLPDWVSSEHIYLKMFKDVPQLDIDMLLPNGGVHFNPFDRLMLWVAGGGSALYALVLAIFKILAVAAISPILLVMTLFGFGGALWRQVASVLNTRNRYMMELSQKLYFHSMSNNQGVLTLLVDEAEEEDIKEDALLYAFLLNAPVPRSEFDEIKASVERFLKREFNLVVDFDHEETLARLKARGLVYESHGQIRAMSAAEASGHLRRLWAKAIEFNPGGTSLDSRHMMAPAPSVSKPSVSTPPVSQAAAVRPASTAAAPEAGHSRVSHPVINQGVLNKGALDKENAS